MSSASIEVVADLVRSVVDIRVAELDEDLEPSLDGDGNEEHQVELSVSPDLARELAFQLSMAAIRVEEHARN